MTLAKIKEDQGNVNEAATVLQELQVRHKKKNKNTCKYEIYNDKVDTCEIIRKVNRSLLVDKILIMYFKAGLFL